MEIPLKPKYLNPSRVKTRNGSGSENQGTRKLKTMGRRKSRRNQEALPEQPDMIMVLSPTGKRRMWVREEYEAYRKEQCGD